MKPKILISILCLLVVSCKKDSPTQSNIDVNEGKDGFTANYKTSDVATLANSLGVSLKMKSISGHNVNIDGTAKSWSYKYGLSQLPGTYYYFTATYESVKFDSTAPMATGDAFITHDWSNSSEALKIAEQNGGAQFRAANPSFTIHAGLGEPVVANPATYWYITYIPTVKANGLSVTIDATTDKVIEIYTIAPR